MKEEWLLHGAVVPVDVETTAALVAEIYRLIGVVGGMALAQPEQEPVVWEQCTYPNCDYPCMDLPDCKEPEQEPVAWIDEYGNTFPLAAKQYSVVGKHWKPLYTTPPQLKPLTEQEIVDLCDGTLTTWEQVRIARAIEAAHNIKEQNT